MSPSLESATTALVLIDLQNGIVSMPVGPHGAKEVVERSVALGRRFNEAGAPVVLVNVGFGRDFADRPPQAVDEPMPSMPGGPPAGWTELVPEVAALSAAVTITKRQWSAFYGTELDLQLRRRGIRTIVLAGIATNFGVESTARDAWQHNYKVVVAEDACTSRTADMHRFAIASIFPRISRVRSTAEVLTAFAER